MEEGKDESHPDRILAKLTELLHESEKTPEVMRLELDEARKKIAALEAEKEAITKEKENLQKQLDDSNKLAECREQMATYYFNAEISALNDIVSSYIQKNNTLSTALSNKEGLIGKVSEILQTAGDNPDSSSEGKNIEPNIEADEEKKATTKKDSLTFPEAAKDAENHSRTVSIPNPKVAGDLIANIQSSLQKMVSKQIKMKEKIKGLKQELEKEKALREELLKNNCVKEAKKVVLDAKKESQELNMGIPSEQMPTLWIPDDFTNKCQLCSTGFGCIFSRPQHCRKCGGIFCKGCSSYTDYVPPHYTIKKVPICKACSEKISAQREIARKQI